MTRSISQPLRFTFDGQRPNNEDFIWPLDVTPKTQLFLVCDGMGGWDKGEVASREVALAIADYVTRHPVDQLDEGFLQQAVAEAHRRLTDYLEQNPVVSRMGSTLALLHLNQQGATVAHIGDSRVYHIRDGEILYKTTDHRQVLDLVRDGIITDQQALTHPWRNRLSRSVAVQGATGADHVPRQPDRADLVQLTDVRPGDYFFLCTDGVLEQVTDSILTAGFSTHKPDADKLADLLAHCEGRTKDNYSGFLVGIVDTESDTPGRSVPADASEPESMPLSEK